ncbi:phakinin isoform X1 [Engraulis encrasicolus]|uniref:phakinin isoform X1 n=1 Tax=Engraulis encrasicolus TaxID=184585 RepID=UPI002FD4D709
MPLVRRRSSLLGQTAADRLGAGVTRATMGVTGAPRGVFVTSSPGGADIASSLGARVSRRALGISSVFLQGLRSTSVPVVPQPGDRGHQSSFDTLNVCLLEYRDKVRALEQLNQQLEEQIRHCLDRKASSAEAWAALRGDWEDVSTQVTEAILDNARLMLQAENMQANGEDFKERYENEQPFRKAVEEEISSLYKVIDDANLTRVDLELQIESMKAELSDLARNHEEDVRMLYNQMAGREVDEPDAPIETNLEQILAYIRSHWEKIIERNRAETDAYQDCKQATTLGSELSREERELERLKTECNDAACKIQSLQAETESMRALKRGLENSMTDAKHWHDIELQNLASVIGKLESELTEVKSDIERQRHDYETLLSNKMKLEQEIRSYHGILDGEECRYNPGRYAGGSCDPEGGSAPAPPHDHPEGVYPPEVRDDGSGTGERDDPRI